MTKTLIRQRNAADIQTNLHKLFNSQRPDLIESGSDLSTDEFIESFVDISDLMKDPGTFDTQNFPVFFDNQAGIKGYVFKLDTQQTWPYPKLFWIDSSTDDLIITTTLYADKSLKNKGSFQSNFTRSELKLLVNVCKQIPGKTIHLIAPRVESTLSTEDHIVMEYQKVAGEQSSRLIIDSKGFLSGATHPSITRIPIGSQELFNSTDCGLHVNQIIPIVYNLLREKLPINSVNITSRLDRAPIDLIKLRELKDIYTERVAKGKHQHQTMGFFKFGEPALDKLAAITKVLDNIDAHRPNLFQNLKPQERKAARKGMLGTILDSYIRHRSKYSPVVSEGAAASSSQQGSSSGSSSSVDGSRSSSGPDFEPYTSSDSDETDDDLGFKP